MADPWNQKRRDQLPVMALVDERHRKSISRISAQNVMILSKLCHVAEKYRHENLKVFVTDFLNISESIDGLRGQEMVDALKGREQKIALGTPVNIEGGGSNGGPPA